MRRVSAGRAAGGRMCVCWLGRAEQAPPASRKQAYALHAGTIPYHTFKRNLPPRACLCGRGFQPREPCQKYPAVNFPVGAASPFGDEHARGLATQSTRLATGEADSLHEPRVCVTIIEDPFRHDSSAPPLAQAHPLQHPGLHEVRDVTLIMKAPVQPRGKRHGSDPCGRLCQLIQNLKHASIYHEDSYGATSATHICTKVSGREGVRCASL